jgi:hypothetical protein
MITESVGFPPMEYAMTPFMTTGFARMGSKIDIERPTALCWVEGAAIVTSATGDNASYAAQRPADVIPSSFVRRIRGFITDPVGGV